jgi:hypothetical protein
VPCASSYSCHAHCPVDVTATSWQLTTAVLSVYLSTSCCPPIPPIPFCLRLSQCSATSCCLQPPQVLSYQLLPAAPNSICHKRQATSCLPWFPIVLCCHQCPPLPDSACSCPVAPSSCYDCWFQLPKYCLKFKSACRGCHRFKPASQ